MDRDLLIKICYCDSWFLRFTSCIALDAQLHARTLCMAFTFIPHCVLVYVRQATEDELLKERDCVSHLIGRMGGACDIRGKPDTTVPGEN
jgi:hypothetical protein